MVYRHPFLICTQTSPEPGQSRRRAGSRRTCFEWSNGLFKKYPGSLFAWRSGQNKPKKPLRRRLNPVRAIAVQVPGGRALTVQKRRKRHLNPVRAIAVPVPGGRALTLR